MIPFAALVCAEVDDRCAQGKAVDLSADGNTNGAIVLGDRLALRRTIANVVDNALAHGRAAHVLVSRGCSEVVLVVDDEEDDEENGYPAGPASGDPRTVLSAGDIT